MVHNLAKARIKNINFKNKKICPSAILLPSVCYPFAIPSFCYPFEFRHRHCSRLSPTSTTNKTTATKAYLRVSMALSKANAPALQSCVSNLNTRKFHMTDVIFALRLYSDTGFPMKDAQLLTYSKSIFYL